MRKAKPVLSESEYYYNQVYFSKNLGKLRLLRRYLREHRNFDPCDLRECRKLKNDGLKIKNLKKHMNVDFSIGDYIKYFGGVEEFLKVPVYDSRISHVLPAIIYARKCKIEDNHPVAVENISLSRSCEILSRLYNTNVNFHDKRVSQLRNWCRRSPSNVNEGLKLFDEELLFEDRSVKEVYESVETQLRISLDSLSRVLVVNEEVLTPADSSSDSVLAADEDFVKTLDSLSDPVLVLDEAIVKTVDSSSSPALVADGEVVKTVESSSDSVLVADGEVVRTLDSLCPDLVVDEDVVINVDSLSPIKLQISLDTLPSVLVEDEEVVRNPDLLSPMKLKISLDSLSTEMFKEDVKTTD